MDDNNLVTHGLHWLTLGQSGWECANPDCDWFYPWGEQIEAQRIFDQHHVKLSEACWLCEGMRGIAPHQKWSEARGKPLWTAHQFPSDDPHPTYPCPVCNMAVKLSEAEASVQP